MGAIKLYFKLAWQLKTPFILILDSRYRVLPFSMINGLCKIIDVEYETDYFDCDDFAWMFKAEAIKRRINGVGFVIGRYSGGLHAWNVALTNSGVFQVEPQTGHIFGTDGHYRPLAVVI